MSLEPRCVCTGPGPDPTTLRLIVYVIGVSGGSGLLPLGVVMINDGVVVVIFAAVAHPG